MSKLIKKTQIQSYVETSLSKGQTQVVARKTGYVLARKANDGETIVTYAGENMEIVETENVAKPSDWILSKSTNDGRVYTSSNGRKNQWIISGETFFKKYELLDEEKGLYRPLASVQTFLQIEEDIDLESPWGSIEHLDAGSYLNITSPSDIYGIQKKDFDDTYEIIG